MKIIFAGTPEIGLETLKTIHGSNHEISLVLTNEDKPSGRGKVISKSPVTVSYTHLTLPTIYSV